MWARAQRPRSARNGVLGALGEVLELLLPGRCLGCQGRLLSGESPDPVCATCRSRLREPPWPRCPRCHFPRGTGRFDSECLACKRWPPSLHGARSAVVLEPPADRLVHALKYGGWPELAPLMAQRMVEASRLESQDPESLVVPVPTTRKRERERGYNQAALLGRAYARVRGLSCRKALQRRGGAPSQVSLHPDERRANVRNAFFLANSEVGRVAGRRVLLIDDVLTTGATACEAAEALERGGASGVTVITFARALPGRRREDV